MQLSYEQFQTDVRRALEKSYRHDQLEDMARGVFSNMQTMMGSRWGESLDLQDMATITLFYTKLEEAFRAVDELDAATNLRSINRALKDVAESRFFGGRMLEDMGDKTLVRILMTPYESLTKSNAETFENMVGINLRTRTTGDLMDRVRVREAACTPKAIIKAAARTKSAALDAATAIPSHASRIAGFCKKAESAPSAPALPQPTTEYRPAHLIRKDYEAAWGNVADALKGTMPLLTLTDATSPAPWLRVPPEKFASHMQDVRTTAKSHRVATKLEPLLKQVEKLHAEHHTAREVGPSRTVN